MGLSNGLLEVSNIALGSSRCVVMFVYLVPSRVCVCFFFYVFVPKGYIVLLFSGVVSS